MKKLYINNKKIVNNKEDLAMAQDGDQIIDSSIEDSNIEDSSIKDSSIEDSSIKHNNIEELKDSNDCEVDNNKVFAALAYILFFLPLLVCKDSTFGKFHANQGLILLLAGIVVNIVGWIVPFIGPLLILPIGSLAILALAILGIINALKGEMKRLPLVGNVDIIK